MAEKLKQKDFKEFEKLFNQVRRANAQERLDAVGTLTPKLLREHLKSGQDLVLAYGRKGHTVKYTLADLQRFSKEIDKFKAGNRPERAGVPLALLEKASLPVDFKKMREQIKSAMLYQVNGNLLTFQVSSSGSAGSPPAYQVKVRLEDWYDHMTDNRTWLAGARLAAVGKISFDCGCARHQYWYRYLATVGNYALTPKEKDFPKIRNPQLTGACCKHMLKVLQQLKSPAMHKVLAGHMERQAGAKGYVDKQGAKYLSPKDLEKARRARGSDKESADALKAFEEFKQARKAYRKKSKGVGVQEENKRLKKKAELQRKENEFLRRQLKGQERRRMADRLQEYVIAAKEFGGLSKEQAVSKFSEKYSMDKKEVISIMEEFKI